VDAALFPNENRMGWGAVIRDHLGNFVLAASEGLQRCPAPEAMAICGALRFAADEGFQNVIIASDCLSMVQRVNFSVQDRFTVGILVNDIKLMMEGFSSCSVLHYGRRMNMAAHKLARSCEHLVFNKFSVILECIREVLCIDVP
jgi:ribonuclease HI